MADKTIDSLTAVTTPASTDEFPVLQSGDAEAKKQTLAQILTFISSGNFTLIGFLSMGGGPNIKQKKLTGTTGATEGDSVDIAHGLTISKILGYHVLVSTASGNRVPPAFTSVAEHEYDAFMNGTNVVVALTAANSGSLLSRAISVLVTYEE